MANKAGGFRRNVKAFWLSLREYFLQRRETRDRSLRQHFRAGVRAMQEARWAEAEAAFKRVLSRDAEHFLAHLYIGVAIYHLGRHEEAHAVLVRAQNLDPERFAVYKASKVLPPAGPDSQRHRDMLQDLVKNLEQCALNLRETAERIHDASRRQQRVIRRLHSPEPLRETTGGGRRRRRKTRKPKVSAFSSPEEAEKFKEMPPITQDDVASVDWDEVIARIFE